MSEDRDNATEEATGKRLSESHSKGQFAQAPEIQVVVGLITSYLVLAAFAPSATEQMKLFMVSILGQMDKFDITVELVTSSAQDGYAFIAFLLMPLLVAVVIAALLAGGLQSGFQFTPGAMEWSAAKLNPLSGLQRIFSPSSIMKMLIDLGKLIIVGSMVYNSVQETLSDPIFYTPVPAYRLGEFIFNSAMNLIFRLSLALGGLALLHYLYQKHKTQKELMMTKQEVKDESKQAEGDPMVKNAIRAMARRFSQKQMMAAVPTADVILTNPTHYAVALKYERGVDTAPVVLAKGKNGFAKRIKQLGLENGVPMVENRPVAQALYKFGEVGEAIPPHLYQAIAEILGFVYKTHRYYFHQLKARRLRTEAR